MPERERGTCPICGKVTALRRGGTIWEHPRHREPHRKAESGTCAGSGLPCAEIAGPVHPLEALAAQRA